MPTILINKLSKILIISIVLLSFLIIGTGCKPPSTTSEKPPATSTNISENSNDSDNIFDKEPFMLSVYYNHNATYAEGGIIYGSVKIGDELDIIGLSEKIVQTKVVKIQIENNWDDNWVEVSKVANSDYPSGVRLFFDKAVEPDSIRQGQVVCTPGTLAVHTKFEAKMTLKTKQQGNNHSFITSGSKFFIVDGAGRVYGTISFMNNKKTAKAGESFMATIILDTPIVIDTNSHFYFGVDPKEIDLGDGKITKIIK